MKKLILSFVLSTLFFTTYWAQNGAVFEFKITSTQGATGSVTANYSSLGSRVEMQINIPQMPGAGFTRTSIIKSAKPSTVYMLDKKNKTYSITETPAQKTANADNCTVKIVGKEKVGNYNCTHAIVTKGKEVTDFWTTTEIADFENYIKSNTGNKYMGSSDDYAALSKNGAAGFIVKTISRESREGEFTMELVKFEKKELNATLFEIPSDYKVSANPASMAPKIDATQLQNMTPEERAKYIEDLKKQYQTPTGN